MLKLIKQHFYTGFTLFSIGVWSNILGRLMFVSSGVVSIAATYGGLGAISCGMGVTLIPYLILTSVIDRTIKNNRPIARFALQLALDVVTACASAMIGATILGLAANPITLCVLGGALGLALSAALIRMSVFYLNSRRATSDSINAFATVEPTRDLPVIAEATMVSSPTQNNADIPVAYLSPLLDTNNSDQSLAQARMVRPSGQGQQRHLFFRTNSHVAIVISASSYNSRTISYGS